MKLNRGSAIRAASHSLHEHLSLPFSEWRVIRPELVKFNSAADFQEVIGNPYVRGTSIIVPRFPYSPTLGKPHAAWWAFPERGLPHCDQQPCPVSQSLTFLDRERIRPRTLPFEDRIPLRHRAEP